MPEIFFHIGMPKSGSSFLQEIVLPKLEEQGLLNFINYQRAGEIINRVVYEDEYTYDIEDVRNSFLQLIKPGKNIISVEWLSGVINYKSFNTFQTADRLYELFPEARVLLIMRNQVDFIYSSYKQIIHQGATISLNEYLNFNGKIIYSDYQYNNFKYDDHCLFLSSLNYVRLLKAYHDFEKKNNLSIFLFEKFKNQPSAFISDFLTHVGLGEEDVSQFDYKLVNRGFGKRQITIARFLNKFVYSSYNRHGVWVLGKKIQALHVRQLLQSNLSFKLLGNKSIKNKMLNGIIQDYYNLDNLKVITSIREYDIGIFMKYYIKK